jgi:hypothetical protein
MGNQRTGIDDNLRAFIQAQRMFFVATAPLDAGGHVNLSPKGLDTFRILGPTTVAYLDHVGSGTETIAHVKENRRIVLMWCAFEGPPNILRLHGRGEVLTPRDREFRQLRPLFPVTPHEGRAILVVTVDLIATSCGFGVPLYRFERERSQMLDWAERKGADGVREYQRLKNEMSIDGLPAVTWLDAGPRRIPEPRQRAASEYSAEKAPKRRKDARGRRPGAS